MSQKDLTLSVGGASLSIWIGVSELISSFDIDVSTFGDGPEVGVRRRVERKYGVP